MSPELQSFLVGTIPLDVLLLVALQRTLSRGAGSPDPALRRRVGGLFAGAIAVQGLHFAEEWAAGFNLRYPELLGLHPWSIELWAGFNFAWLAIWSLALLGLRLRWRAVLFPVWFLAVACVVNCAVHPLLALAVAGYFPGLWSSPLCGLVGVPLFVLLGRFTAIGRQPAR